MREAALESVRSTAEELLKQAGDYDDEAVKGLLFSIQLENFSN